MDINLVKLILEDATSLCMEAKLACTTIKKNFGILLEY